MPDRYTLHARIYPAVLVLLPVAITLIGRGWGSLNPINAGLTGGMLATVAYGVSHLTRTAGRRLERKLFREWGGKPTTVRLRMRTATTGESKQRRDREYLAQLVPETPLPTLADESRDPAGAEESYEAVVAVLRELTRDSQKHPVVFAENISYGFRRNTLAIKKIGIAAAAGCLAALTFQAWRAGLTGTTLLASSLDLALLLFWAFVVTPSWVRDAAERYAEALFACLPVLVRTG